jgi:hypothetical protein
MRKNKTGKVIIVALASIILLGGIGAVGGWIGYEKGQEIVDNIDLFTDVKIVDQEKVFTGETLKLDMTLPENATETHVIKRDDVVVLDSLVKAVGVYKYDVVVTIGKATRNFKATLTIKEKAVENVTPKLTPRLAKVSDTEYKVTASVYPETFENEGVEWSLAFKDPSSSWATGKTITQYVSSTTSLLSINLKLVKAFGEQIVLSCTSKADSKLKSSCTLDYEKRLLNNTFTFNGNDGSTTQYIDNNKVLSIVSNKTFSEYSKDKTFSDVYTFGDTYSAGKFNDVTTYSNWEYDDWEEDTMCNVNLFHFNVMNEFFTTNFKNGFTYTLATLKTFLTNKGSSIGSTITGATYTAHSYTGGTSKTMAVDTFVDNLLGRGFYLKTSCGTFNNTFNFTLYNGKVATLSVSDSSITF